ncbi:MAG TPA: DUF5703 domain-containing protein [Rariglobus sp.]|jgi:hypothetical protein|nr:DUF5703 domain-containing protein [Rariglobus sp.]
MRIPRHSRLLKKGALAIATIIAASVPLFGQSSFDLNTSLDACNVSWTEPGPTSAQSMPIGNGDIGLNVWVEANGDLDFYIGKTDAWSDSVQGSKGLMKIGAVKVSLNPRPAVTPFTQVLKLRTGEIVIQENTTTLRVWVDANNPVIRVEVSSPTATTVTALANNWRTGSEEVTLTGQTGRIGWYHRNSATADSHVANRTFGAIIKGAGMTRVNDTTLSSSTPVTSQLISIYPLTTATAPVAQWQSQLDTQIVQIESLNLETTRTAHQTWWNQFWNRSWVFVHGDTDATATTEGYVLQRFVTACGGRGAYPIKFNGSIFVVDNPALASNTTTMAVDADYRTWGGQYWFQNTRAMYWPRLMAGDFDIMRPLFDMYAAQVAPNAAQVTGYYGHGGAYFAETAPYWGGLQYAGPDAPENFTLHYFTPTLELSMMMLDYYDYTGDTAFAQQKLIPIMKAGLQFFNEHFARDAQGKLLLNPDNAIETYWKVNNPAPDIAGLTAILQRGLALPSNILDSTTRSAWTALQQQIPPLPIGTNNGTQVLLPYTGDQTAPRKNGENPELYAIYPFRLYGLGKANYEMALDSFNARIDRQSGCWGQDPIHAAMVGLADTAKSKILYNLTRTDPRQKFQAFWASGHDYTPDEDNGGNGENGLQQMIMQVDGKSILLAPAWPKGWDCDFKLNAPYQTTIQGSIVAGKITNLVVTPSSRTVDVLDMSTLSPGYLSGYDLLYQQDTIAAVKWTSPGSANVLAVVGTDYSSGETAAKVIDWNVNTKHYDKAQDGTYPKGVHTGFVVTPKLGSSIVTAILLATGNDMPNRDPRLITIEGSNAANADQAGGSGFSLIYSGPAGLLPNQDRKSLGLYASFPNTTAYKTYRVLISSTAGGTSSDGTQYSEASLLGTLVNTLPGNNVLSATDTTVALKQTVAGGTNTLAISGTDFSTGETSAKLTDGNLSSKYYDKAQDGTNPKGVNTGFVITPAAGATAINGFQLATANDMPARDPVSITIEGSNASNATQAGAGGFTLLYNGPSGLQQGLPRSTWGSVVNFWNTTPYATYRILVTGTAATNSGDGTQYSEVRLLAAPSEGVTFYQNANYGGTVSQPLAKGSYTLAQLSAKGVPNDWASSLKIPAGWTAILYQDDNFSGNSWTLTADSPDLSTLTPTADDKVSSCVIQ